MGFTLYVSLDAYKGPRSYYTNNYGVRACVVVASESLYLRNFPKGDIFFSPHLDIAFVS